MTHLPQMWELAAYRQAAEIAEIEERVELAAAVAQATVTFADRARGATGQTVVVRLQGEEVISGRVELATDECLVLSDGMDHRLIPTAAVVSVAMTRMPTALPARGLERTGMRAILRARLGMAIRVDLDAGSDIVGVLREVGQDHIVVEPLSSTPNERLAFISTCQLRWLGWREDTDAGFRQSDRSASPS